MIEGFSMPFRFDRNRSGGVVIVYIWGDIPSKQLTKHKLPDDIEGVFDEVNLWKNKWLILAHIALPASQWSISLDPYGQIYENFLLAGDFNAEETEPCLSEFLSKYDSKYLVKDKTCLKNPKNPGCTDLFITNSIGSFQKTTSVASSLSDFHKMIVTVLKTYLSKI